MYSISVSDKQLYAEGTLSFKGIMEAYKSQDPRLAEYVVKLCILDPAPPKPVSKNEVSPISYETFRKQYHKDAIDPKVLENITVPNFGVKKQSHQKNRQKKAQLFTQRFDEFARNEHMVPDRLKVGEFLIMLYDDPSLYAQDQFREVMRYVPLKWGPWQAFKYVLKRGLTDQRWLTFAVMYDRMCSMSPYITTKINYRSRLPNAIFPLDMESVQWNNDWSFNRRKRANDITTETHIFFCKRINHLLSRQFSVLGDDVKEALLEPMLIEAKEFHAQNTRRGRTHILSKWAHNLQWNKNADSLMRIFLQAKNSNTSEWALHLLIEHHHSTMVNLSPQWVLEQGCSKNTESSIKKFIAHWICDPITNIPKNDFLNNGLYLVIFGFIFENKTFGPKSTRAKAQTYACKFIREFLFELKEKLSFERVQWLLRHRDTELHELGLYLLFPDGEDDSPFVSHLTLEFWTDLLGDTRLHNYAVQQIERKFSKRELSKEWIKGRLYDSKSSIVNLAKEYIEEGRHAANIDWYDVYLENLFGSPGKQKLTSWAWDNINKVDESGSNLLSRFTAQEYRKLMVHAEKTMRSFAYDAYENEHIKPEDFPVRFLRNFIHRNEYDRKDWKTYFTETDISHAHSLPDDLQSFCIKTLENRLDRTVEKLGVRWVLQNKDNSDKQYDFVRDLFQREFPIYQLSLLNEEIEEAVLTDTLSSKEEGCRTVLDLVSEEYDQSSGICIFWRKFLRSRLARFREEEGLEDLSDKCLIDPSFFSFDWFRKEMRETKHARRAFALEIGSLFLTDWIASESKFGFVELGPFLFSHYDDVATFTLSAIRNPSSHHAVIDISGPQFTPEELYGYIFSDNSKARQQGVQIIYGNLEKFAQPDKLILLTQSPDPFVRAMVISIMHQIAHIPQTTSQWSVYEDSVIPNNSTKNAKKRIRTKRVNPKGGSPITSQKMLGAGTSERLSPDIKAYDELVQFAERELFRIPKNPPKKKGVQTSKNRIPGWKTKRTLMEAFRDLSLQDRIFAGKMIPIFQELVFYKGNIVRDMALSSLAYIEKKYENESLPELSILSELSVNQVATEQDKTK